MTSIDVQQISSAMIGAAKGIFKTNWPKIKDYAEGEFEKLARTLAQIETLKVSGQITDGEASVLFEMQKNTTRAVMLAIKGMSLLMVEAAINAALKAVQDVTNKALGFSLI